MAPFSLEVAVYGQLLQKQTTRRGQLSVISLSRSWAIAGDAIPDGHYAVVDLLHHEAMEIEKIAGHAELCDVSGAFEEAPGPTIIEPAA